MRLHHRLDGPEEAPVLVLSGSLGTTHAMWDAQAPELAARLRLLRYDPRGHGRSEVPPGPYSVADLGRDVVGLLDRYGIERASFCGLSIGGMTGMWLGANASDRIDRLVIACAPPYAPPREQWDERAEVARTEGVAALADGTLERWFTPSFREQVPEEVERFRAMLRDTDGEGYAACCEAIRDMDLRNALPGIAAPALVIAGADDPTVPPDRAEEVAAALPDGRLHVIDDARHIANVAQPREFTDVVLDFLTGGVAR